MEVNFDIVRIGKIRKNRISEMILKQNVEFLKNGIRSLLKDNEVDSKKDLISMVLVIPAKGHSIKIALRDIKESYIKKELKNNFPNSIYKGDYKSILDNINNLIF